MDKNKIISIFLETAALVLIIGVPYAVCDEQSALTVIFSTTVAFMLLAFDNGMQGSRY